LITGFQGAVYVDSAELTGEQKYVAGLYSRLDELREAAKRELTRVQFGSAGGTHQSRSERDAFARIYEDRIAQLSQIDERLAFGRLDLAETDDDHLRYIGRIGLRDDEQQPLLLDWRVPQARAFYQATAATPLGVRARRHLQSKGRDIVAYSDEVFDRQLLEQGGTALQGESALLAAVSARRTGRMGDIVATIQAEQDRIIRSELRGVLVVQGGPGTGKTAVALHRAAYLLYSHRERLAASGVLIVGPSRSFLQYIESVLPSLGETGVVLASVGQLYPGIEVTAEDRPATAVVKGAVEMADLLHRAVKSRQKVPTEPTTVDVNGEKLVVRPELIRAAMNRAWDSRKPHNLARATFNKAALQSLTRELAEQLRSHGNTVDEEDQKYLLDDLRNSYDVKVVLNTAWIPLTPERLLQDLYARPQWLASLTPRWSEEKRALLRRERDADFTISDVPLLDEAAELLGVADSATDAAAKERERQRKRDIENAEQAIRNMDVEGFVDAKTLAAGFEETGVRLTTAEAAASDRTWTYGHIVVDEAQELSPMQWRLLQRRGPGRSFTIVGDVAQASAAAGATTWESALGSFGSDNWRLEELTVNYRTPAQIARAAESMALAHGLRVTQSESVREGEQPVHVHPAGDLVSVITAERAADGAAGIAVIALEADEVASQLRGSFGEAVGRGAPGLSKPIVVISPTEAKGLEFDTVIVCEPAHIVRSADRGAALLYVAMTRPTQRLHLVTDEKLPAGITP
jgi:DNA helicase IV